MPKKQEKFEDRGEIEIAKALAAEAEADLARSDAAEVIEGTLEGFTQKEIAEAFRLTGQIEGINFIGKVATVSTLMMLKSVKENKVYRRMPGVENWENFCKLTGFSRRLIDEQLLNLETLGEEFLATCFQFGLGYRELKKLRSATTEGMLAIEGDVVTVTLAEGEAKTVPLSDTEGVRELIEQLSEVITNQKQDLEVKDRVMDSKNKALEDAEKAVISAERKLKKYEGGEIRGMPAEDFPDFEEMEEVVKQLSHSFFRLQGLLQRSSANMSETNRQYLLNTVLYNCQLAFDLRSMAANVLGDIYNTEEPLPEDYALNENSPIPGVRPMKGHKAK
jgi:hypothetical protein